MLDPGQRCPDCGGVLRLVGEDVAEILDFIAAKLKVVEVHRPKKSCRDCERMVQTPAPPRPIPRGIASPALLAHILVAKYDDYLPLYRQGEIFARMGADIPRSTLIDWCGQAAGALRPLADLIRDVVIASDRIHADDTPIHHRNGDRPVQDRGHPPSRPVAQNRGRRVRYPRMGGLVQSPAHTRAHRQHPTRRGRGPLLRRTGDPCRGGVGLKRRSQGPAARR